MITHLVLAMTLPCGSIPLDEVGDYGNFIPDAPGVVTAAPNMFYVETRRDGILLTFDHPIAGNSSDHGISISLTPDVTTAEPFTPPMIEDVVFSPDGYRAFFRIPTFVPGSIHGIRLESSNWNEGLSTKLSPATVHLDSDGPDFAASLYEVHPALSRTAPPGAVMLFDGSSTSNLVMRNTGGPVTWSVVDSQLVSRQGQGDVLSTETLGDGLYHIEWLSPAGGDASIQKNGNSGVKFEERYELQILNNAGSPRQPLFNESGAIYRIRPADSNASMGPGKWQTYHVWYTSPRWDGDRKLSDARMTVYWNDVLVHDDVTIPDKTGASIDEGPDPQRLLLQDHASSAEDAVRFRNIWHVPASKLPVNLQLPGPDASTRSEP